LTAQSLILRRGDCCYVEATELGRVSFPPFVGQKTGMFKVTAAV